MRLIKMKKKSLVFTMSMVITLILLLTAVLLFVFAAYGYRVSKNQLIDSQKSIMALIINQINSELKQASSVLSEIAGDYLDNVENPEDQDELRRYLASIRRVSFLETKIEGVSCLDGVFFRYASGDDVLMRFDPRLTWMERFEIYDYIYTEPEVENALAGDVWHTIELDGKYYLLKVYRLRSSSFGVIVSIDNFIDISRKIDADPQMHYAVTDISDTVLATSAPETFEITQTISNNPALGSNNALLLTLGLPDVSLRLSCLLSNQEVLFSDGYVVYILAALGISAAIVTFSGIYIRRQIIKPITGLVVATKKVEKGDWEYRISTESNSVEFDTLINSFNYMTHEIKELKISSYEDKINKQKIELQYLQRQLKPHFYLNAISTISSLSIQGKNGEIQRFVLALSDYLRYMVTDNLAMVNIDEEISHAMAFVKMQQVRFPDKIFFMSNIDDDTKHVPIPKLIIQTFVENIFKHAFDNNELLSIFVNARREETHNQIRAVITIEDNGCGFSEEFLSAGRYEKNANIGIYNVTRTLQLTYGNKDDLLTLCNGEQGGAKVIISIPID